MPTWADLAKNNLSAAKALHEGGFVRGSLNRSYYSAYAGITGALVEAGHSVNSGDRPNPRHDQLQSLARNNLAQRARKEVSRNLNRLRAFREAADYDPASSLESQDSLIGVQYATRILALIGGEES
jgi:uncharacterized protein (UPF0332 family)